MINKIITVLFLVYIFTFSILGIALKDKEISYTERRKLQSFPSIIMSSEYINKIDKYLLDHFPLRDTFRSIKANFNYKVLNKLDNNKIYLKDNYIFKSEYPTNKESIERFINIFNKTKDNFNDNNVYVMIIPDKNYYLKDDNFMHIDYDYIYNEINKMDASVIDIRNILSLSDYYETDTHWRQEKIEKVVSKMSEVMDFDYKKQIYKENIYDKFYGVYYGESAIERKPEKLVYLTNDDLNSLRVKYLENDKLNSIYSLDKLNSVDAYEVYLDGASAFIEIYNDKSNSDKELVIFRDSFASSLTPLITNYYKKITLIDNRYITSDNYLKKINFDNQDVLFMYSTLLVNNSGSIKG